MVSIQYLIIIFSILYHVLGYDDAQLCNVCHVLVDEIEYEISKADPKKVIEVEGFRVDPSGNQKRKKLPYVRSETHLTEITENLCEKMNQYALSKNPDTGVQSYVRTASRSKDETLELKDINMSSEIAKDLKDMCETFIEDHEESILEFFREPASRNPVDEFCIETVDVCSTNKPSENSVEETEEEEDEEKDEL